MPDFHEITLRPGPLHFTALEAGEGPLVVCIHGFPDHHRTWRMQLKALAEQGYHVVAPLIRGYEFYSQPADGDYHMARAAEDVVSWLDALHVDKAHLVGHDWGAVMTYAAAAKAPERFHSISTLAVPHLRHMHRGLGKVPTQALKSWYMLFFQLRLLSDRVVERNDFAFIERLWRDWSPGWEWDPLEMEAVKQTFRNPGVREAALGYYRNLFRPLSRSGRETMKLLFSKITVPTLALTGAADGCMDTRLYDVIMDPEDFPAGLRVVRLDGAGHFLHQEKPEAVNAELLDWFREWGE